MRAGKTWVPARWLVLLAGAACAPPGPSSPADDPLYALLERADLQVLVEAGLDRRTAPLLEALAGGDVAARTVAARALASVQDPTAADALAAALGDADPAVRREAAFALGQLGQAGPALALLETVRVEDDAGVRGVMLEAVGKVGDGDLLHRLLDEVNPDEAELPRALYHFARRGVATADGGAALLSAIKRADETQSEAAAQALAAGRDPSRWGLSMADIRSAAAGLDLDRAALGPLLGVLAREGDPADIPLLVRSLTASPAWRVRRAAAAALQGHSETPSSREALDALWSALDDLSAHVAGTAAGALARAAREAGADAGAPLRPRDLAGWVRAHPERPSVSAALLPGLVGTSEEETIAAFARGEISAGAFAYPALAASGHPDADKILLAGLRGERRKAYAAATALADRLSGLPATAALHDSVALVLAERLDAWGPLAPASDVRGVSRLLDTLFRVRPGMWPKLERVAASHPHAMIREQAGGLVRDAVDPPSSPRRAEVDWDLLRRAGPYPQLEFTTRSGSFVVELDAAQAPLSVSSILTWVEAGAYDGLPFHRVEADFILQSGDIPHPGGHGGPDAGLRSEFGTLRFVPGVVGMASAGKDTEGSQYFITHGLALSLDGRYTAVGRIVSGSEGADAVALDEPAIRVRRLTDRNR